MQDSDARVEAEHACRFLEEVVVVHRHVGVLVASSQGAAESITVEDGHRELDLPGAGTGAGRASAQLARPLDLAQAAGGLDDVGDSVGPPDEGLGGVPDGHGAAGRPPGGARRHVGAEDVGEAGQVGALVLALTGREAHVLGRGGWAGHILFATTDGGGSSSGGVLDRNGIPIVRLELLDGLPVGGVGGAEAQVLVEGLEALERAQVDGRLGALVRR
ncbi:hypothetical protein PG984_005614 [Apiospora sp. TS-2023a]